MKTDLEPWKTNLEPWKTMKNQPRTMKNHEKPWKTMKNHENHEKPDLGGGQGRNKQKRYPGGVTTDLLDV